MRTNIEIDDSLIRKVMRRSGERTKRAAVDAALRLMDKLLAQGDIRQLKGKVRWTGDLNESRLGRTRR